MADSINRGKRTLCAPRSMRFAVSRIMPIINPVMAAEALGASRRGRYPTRSTSIPRKEVKNMLMMMVSARSSHPGAATAPILGHGHQQGGDSKADVGAHHEDVPMGEIKEHQNAVNHGISQGNKGIKTPPLKGVYQVLEKEDHLGRFLKNKRRGRVFQPGSPDTLNLMP